MRAAIRTGVDDLAGDQPGDAADQQDAAPRAAEQQRPLRTRARVSLLLVEREDEVELVGAERRDADRRADRRRPARRRPPTVAVS